MGFKEHIQVILGLDGSAVSKGLASMRQKFASFGTNAKDNIRNAQKSMRALAMEFPVLGRLTELVFNPISLAVVGIVGAFKLWKYRVDELNKTFSETKIPNFFTSETGTKRIDAGADSWKKYGDAVKAAREALFGMDAQHNKTMAGIQRLFDLMEEVAGPSAGRDKEETVRLANEKEAQAGRLRERAANARASAAAIQRGLNTGLAGLDPQTRKRMIGENQMAVASADADIKTRRERMDFLGEAQNAGWMDQGTNIKFRARYGNNMGIDEARKLEMDMLERAETQKRAAENRIKQLEDAGGSGRKKMDELLGQAAKDDAAAAGLSGAARDMTLEGQIKHGVDRLKSGRKLIPSQMGMGESTSNEAIAAIRSALAQAGVMDKFAKGQTDVLDQIGLGKKYGDAKTPDERTAGLIEELLDLAYTDGLVVRPMMGE